MNFYNRKFKKGDRVWIVNPGANRGDCKAEWLGATAVIIKVEHPTYEGNLVYKIQWDVDQHHELDELVTFWVTEREIALEPVGCWKIVDVNDLL